MSILGRSTNSDSSSPSPGPSGDENDPSKRSESNSNRNRNNARRGPWMLLSWLRSVVSSPQLQLPLRIALNVAMLYLLMRIWPVGGRAGLSSSPNKSVESMNVRVPFSEFIRRVRQDEVEAVVLDGPQVGFTPRTTTDLTTLSNSMEGHVRITYFTQRPIDYVMPYDKLESNGVVFSTLDQRHDKVPTILMYVLAAGLFLMTISRLPLRLPNAKGTGRRHKGAGDAAGGAAGTHITFADVAGVDEAKEELQEIVEYLRAPERFLKLGARPPCGVLLVGPPGTGKTMLARAVAGEADVPFFSISASEFVELYVGMGAMRVRELFANARKEAPAIVFIDEVDAVAKGRDSKLRSVGNDEREQTLNQLLTELDGFDSDKDKAVICLAATNRPDVLDAALLRPGRFDRRVMVERPDRLGREQILGVHIKRRALPLSSDVSAPELAAMTTGFTGADLANLVNEAALLAGRKGKTEVGREEFDAAVMRAVAGIEKKRSILQGVEKEVVARHEVGHALVATAVQLLLPVHASSVDRLSIIPRSGGALGFTYMPPKTEDRALMFDSEIRGQLSVLMAGRAAEQLTCDALSTGAVDDIRRATDLAQRMVSEFGLSPAVGPVNVSVLTGASSDDLLSALSPRGSGVSRAVEDAVRALVEGALDVALAVVEGNRGLHRELSRVLETKERVEGEELQGWLQGVQVPDVLRDFVLRGQLPPPSSTRR